MIRGLFSRKKSLLDSGLLEGAADNHSHVLYGVDDGVKTLEESLSILEFLETAGLKTLWLTPHIMEDVPNTTQNLKLRFEELRSYYKGSIELNLASEYMLDTLFVERLKDKDLLLHGQDWVLVETSTWAPPIDFWDIIDDMRRAGYRPLIAHPERYRYMRENDYQRLHDMGALLQLNLPSIIGVYGKEAYDKALYLLGKGWYSMAGSDCHRYKAIDAQYQKKVFNKNIIRLMEPIMYV